MENEKIGGYAGKIMNSYTGFASAEYSLQGGMNCVTPHILKNKKGRK